MKVSCKVDKHREEAKEFLNSLSRDEVKELLIEAGFEIEDGESGIVFTDDPIKDKIKLFDEEELKNPFYKGYRQHHYFKVNE